MKWTVGGHNHQLVPSRVRPLGEEHLVLGIESNDREWSSKEIRRWMGDVKRVGAKKRQS